MKKNSIGKKTYRQAATSDNTRKAYQHDIRHFIHAGGLLPTTTDALIQYLEHTATQLNPRTLSRRLTALKLWHTQHGFYDPTSHPAVRQTLTGIHHVHGKPKAKATPLTLDVLTTFVQFLTDAGQLIDWRDNALLQIGFFGAFRRSELVAIEWEHINTVNEGIEILIPRSKTDQHGEGEICAIPYGHHSLCPVHALNTWKENAQIDTGPVFRRMTKGQRVLAEAIRPQQVNHILKTLASACQLPHPERYSSHSLRRGFASTASLLGAPFGAIRRQGRWRHDGTVLGYIDEGKRFEANAAGIILQPATPSAINDEESP